jgi:hypothetical protein
MAKNSNGPTVHVRVKRPKTAAQQAQAVKNAAAATERTRALAAAQERMNALRAEFPGRTMSDEQCRRVLHERDQFAVLQGWLADEKVGLRLRRFLGRRLDAVTNGSSPAAAVMAVVFNYLRTQGVKT